LALSSWRWVDRAVRKASEPNCYEDEYMNIIARLIEILKAPVFASEKTSPGDTPQPFSRVAASGRIIRAYSGFLPCSQHTARHILRCEHLRELPGQKVLPYRAEPEYTHQIWIWYRLYNQPSKLNLVFRGQFDFTIANNEADIVAREITDFLVYLMLNAKDPREVLRNKDSELYWAAAIERKFKNMLNMGNL